MFCKRLVDEIEYGQSVYGHANTNVLIGNYKNKGSYDPNNKY